MTIEEVLEKMMKEYDANPRGGTWSFARAQYMHDCRRVLESAARCGIRFS